MVLLLVHLKLREFVVQFVRCRIAENYSYRPIRGDFQLLSWDAGLCGGAKRARDISLFETQLAASHFGPS